MAGFLDKIRTAFRPTALSTRVTPTEPLELRGPPDPGRKPKLERYRDLPILGSSIFEEVSAIRNALSSFELGQFWQSAQLVDAFGVDDRITGVTQTRLDALFGLPLEVSSRTGKSLAEKKAARVQQEWPSWFADAELKKLLKWALYLRVAVGEILWDTTDGSYWKPRLKTWDPRYLFFRWDTRSFWLTTMDGPVEVTPGDGHWVLYAPDGATRGWMNGHVRSLALLYLIRRWAIRDWARYSEVHGLPIKKAKVPAGLPPEDKEAFIEDLETLGSEGLIRLAVDETGNGFDLSLMEAASDSWQGFEKLIAKADECIAVDLLGQNLTTAVGKGGSYAAANVHDRIRLDRVESDSKSLGDCLSEQVLVPWAIYNFGDPDAAPRVRWSTKIEEQRGTTATTWSSLAGALEKLTKARQVKDGKKVALNVDLEAVAVQFKIPLVSGEPLVEAEDPQPPTLPGVPGEKPEEAEPEEPAEKPEEKPEGEPDDDEPAEEPEEKEDTDAREE